MEGLGLLIGHLLGDYVFQNDWQAQNKTTKTWPCVVHCLLYTLAVLLCSFWWFPLWAVLLTGLIHFPIDRWRLARKWMTLNGQEGFASGPLSPWSIIVVDNTIHLLTLYLLGLVALKFGG